MIELNSDIMMLLSGLLEQPDRVPSTTTAVLVQIQSVEDMADQTYQYDDEAMRIGNGDPSQALVPVVPRVEEPEEQTVALQATDLSFPKETVARSGARIFVHAPQYHWHTSGTGGIDQEARERLVALEALVDRFGWQRIVRRYWPAVWTLRVPPGHRDWQNSRSSEKPGLVSLRASRRL